MDTLYFIASLICGDMLLQLLQRDGKHIPDDDDVKVMYGLQSSHHYVSKLLDLNGFIIGSRDFPILNDQWFYDKQKNI